MTPENLLWKVDKRKKDGGSNVCAACFKENHRAASERRRAGWRAQNTKRYDKVRGRKYRGPNQLTEDVAWRIINEELNGVKAVALAEKFAPTIASGRIRFTSQPSRVPCEDEVLREVRNILEVVDKLGVTGKKNPLAHLNVKPDAERAWDRFNKALELARLTGENQPNCQDRPAEFVDFDEEDLPTAEEAYRLCYGCPLLELCASYAEQERPAWGVHAGSVWAAGEIVNNE
jgi:hypothetical protein